MDVEPDETSEDLLACVSVPLAVAPSGPFLVTGKAALKQGALPSFTEHAEALLEFHEKNRLLHDICSRGKRLSFKLIAELQRSGPEGVNHVLDELKSLQSPPELLGHQVWSDPEKRLQLCDAAGVSHFVENYVAGLALKSFLSNGVLTPEMPQEWRLGIVNRDDESYLLGVIDASGELVRFATNRGRMLDLKSIRLCLGVLQSLEQTLMQFDFRNGDVRRRFDGVKYSVKKLENLAYEVDLSIQRASATPDAQIVDSAVRTNDLVTNAESEVLSFPEGEAKRPEAIDLALYGSIKTRYDEFDKMREDVIKRSRDVIKAAKNATYALQRGDNRKADGDLKQSARFANALYKDLVSRSPSLRGGLFSAALEELAEALAYRAFRQDRCVLSKAALQKASGLECTLSIHEYFGGLMDLTGEICRFAVRSASKGCAATPDVECCLACIDGIYQGLQDLPFLPSGIGKKMNPLRGSLTKVEGVLYELALLTRGGLRVQAPPSLSNEAGAWSGPEVSTAQEHLDEA